MGHRQGGIMAALAARLLIGFCVAAAPVRSAVGKFALSGGVAILIHGLEIMRMQHRIRFLRRVTSAPGHLNPNP